MTTQNLDYSDIGQKELQRIKGLTSRGRMKGQRTTGPRTFVAEKNVATDKKLHERDLAKLRQQRRRSIMNEREIKEGVRSPGGTKRKVR